MDMRSNDEQRCNNCGALELIDKVIGFNGWPEMAPAIKETLMTLMLTYIRSERIEGDNNEIRDTIAYHIWTINNLISDLATFEINNPKTKVA